MSLLLQPDGHRGRQMWRTSLLLSTVLLAVGGCGEQTLPAPPPISISDTLPGECGDCGGTNVLAESQSKALRHSEPAR